MFAVMVDLIKAEAKRSLVFGGESIPSREVLGSNPDVHHGYLWRDAEPHSCSFMVHVSELVFNHCRSIIQ